MTRNQKIELTDRNNAYAEKALQDIDTDHTPIGVQLERLKPVMQEIAAETNKSIEEIFIIYMDTNSELGAQAEKEYQSRMEEMNL